MKYTRRRQKINNRREKKRRDKQQKNDSGNRQQARYNELLKSQSFAESHGDLGRLLYSYSDARAWIDLPRGRNFKKIFSWQRVFCFSFAVLLCAWFVTALIYQLRATSDTGKTLLHLLPSFFIIAAGVAILLISVFKGWGKLLRWGYRHNLVRGKGAVGKRQFEQMRLELELADFRKSSENRLDITPDYIVWTVDGKEEIFKREFSKMRVCKREENLQLVLKSEGEEREFPVLLPAEEYTALKKALRDGLTVTRISPKKSENETQKLIKELPFILAGIAFRIAGVMLIITHYVWVPEVPPFMGMIFIFASPLFVLDTFAPSREVKTAGVPLTVSLILLTACPWAFVWWFQLRGSSFGQFLLNCDPFTVAVTFFTVLGVYVFIFATMKLIDYIRFGSGE